MDNVPINQRWYQSYCRNCPYLVKDEVMEKLHCVRPVGESCLVEGILVAGVIMADTHNARMKKSYEDNNGPTAIKQDTVLEDLSRKRRSKLPKRRR